MTFKIIHNQKYDDGVSLSQPIDSIIRCDNEAEITIKGKTINLTFPMKSILNLKILNQVDFPS